MISLTLLSAIAASPLLISAAPTDAQATLAAKYAPVIHFEKDEVFFSSSVDFFLKGPITPKDATNAAFGGEDLTPSNLDDLPDKGQAFFLTTDLSEENLKGFLTGQKDSGAKLYTFVTSLGNDVADVFYWAFSPFNRAKALPFVGQAGDHVGDWERMRLRTVKGSPVSFEYHAHSIGGSGTIPWAEVPKLEGTNQPLAFCANGSHGFYPTPGEFVFSDLTLFNIKDTTTQDGVAWDTKNDLVVFNYPDTYDGDASFLNFKGRWGNRGDQGCPTFGEVSICPLVDAPDGPIREVVMGPLDPSSKNITDTPMSHTLGKAVSSDSSKFSVWVNVQSANADANVSIGLRQRCTKGSDGNKAGRVELIDIPAALAQQFGIPTPPPHPQPERQFKSAVAGGKAKGKIDFTVEKCPDEFVLDGYTVVSCAGDKLEQCDFSKAQDRLTRAYKDGSTGVQVTQAIELEDMDVWNLDAKLTTPGDNNDGPSGAMSLRSSWVPKLFALFI